MSCVKYAFESSSNLIEFANVSGVSSEIIPVAPSKSRNDDQCLGIDLYASYDFVVPAFDSVLVNTGVCFDMSQGATLWPRSKSRFLVGAGVIDQSYTGPIYVEVVNYRSEPLSFGRGSALCQMVGVREDWGDLVQVDRIEKETARGRSGGITGKSVDS